MKINVGMYCYNKTNRKLGIGKVISFQGNNNVNIRYKNDIELVSIGNVVASPDIIDLAMKDDFVNGFRVVEFYENNRKEEPSRMVYCEFGNGFIGFYNEDIKSIITREQIEQVSYKVGKQDD